MAKLTIKTVTAVYGETATMIPAALLESHWRETTRPLSELLDALTQHHFGRITRFYQRENSWSFYEFIEQDKPWRTHQIQRAGVPLFGADGDMSVQLLNSIRSGRSVTLTGFFNGWICHLDGRPGWRHATLERAVQHAALDLAGVEIGRLLTEYAERDGEKTNG